MTPPNDARIGKTVYTRVYFHVSALNDVEPALREKVQAAANIAGVRSGQHFNVCRVDLQSQTVALLDYPAFFELGCPLLRRSWKVDLSSQRATLRTYEGSLNPPVLHRKELLLPTKHPDVPGFGELTNQLQQLGVFEDPVRIGFKRQWEALLQERGFRIDGNELCPIGNVEAESDADSFSNASPQVSRHLTALSRTSFSAPVQQLFRHGLLHSATTFFDYGCGKGDDVRGLVEQGFNASGWDPYFAADRAVQSAEIVNLGFVINVIEDPVERRDALTRAFSICGKVLAVSAMLAAEHQHFGISYADGFLTGRGTFQKYFTQTELKAYLEEVLNTEPTPAAPGVFFVFKDKDAEQQFDAARFQRRVRLPIFDHPPGPPRQSREPKPRVTKQPRPTLFEQHRAMLDVLWAQALELGRFPELDEVDNVDALVETLGTLRKAIRTAEAHFDLPLLESARRQRAEDLLVMYALRVFQKRAPYKSLNERLQRDTKAFFGTYAAAIEEARDVLQSIADPSKLDAACETAAEAGLGHLQEGHSLQLHASLVPRLPALLRVYVGCGTVLYGDLTTVDVVKIHIRSAKVTFMRFDNFLGSALPRLLERTKIDLRTLDMQVFQYGREHEPPYLYFKSRYTNEECLNHAEQVAFDHKLAELGCVDTEGYGPPPHEFAERLRRVRWKADGFSLVRDHYVPGLDDRCGRFLTYRQLIECGETQHRLRITNRPTHPASYTALFDLAANVLDPVIEYFGAIELTYGFCSKELSKHIRGRVAPELDQHAAHEPKRTGDPICSRLGAAVDFLVRDEDMEEVAAWIVANLPFDRLYYYGSELPLHVSFGPEHKRAYVEMRETVHGRRVPSKRIRSLAP
jgi:DNA phosphorothioation-associated putative methyltransferase